MGISVGNFFPQVQTGTAGYQKTVNSGANPLTYNVGGTFAGTITPPGTPATIVGTGPLTLIPPVTYENVNVGLNMAWEVDFWGRFRRAITAAEDSLEANCAAYNGAMVTMLGDVASSYVAFRTNQKRLELLVANANLQRHVMEVAKRRFDEGQSSDLDYNQARSNLDQTEAQVPLVLSDLRAEEVRLCVLMGMPPIALEPQLGAAPIPVTPNCVAVGIPADLLRRRPDVCRAERLAAAQAEQIGIAEVDLYPIFKLNGDMGWSAANTSHLFESNAFYGTIGPGIQWNLLNYGRIRNNIRYQDAKLKELVTTYQRLVLQASEEVENSISHFRSEQDRVQRLDDGVRSMQLAVESVVRQYEAGGIDFTRVSQVERELVLIEETQAVAQGQVAQGLIDIYRALGGGWEAGAGPQQTGPVTVPAAPVALPPAPSPPKEEIAPPPPAPEPPKPAQK